MEFEFGTNWATYSRYVGDIFGSALAAEGVFAFALESTCLGIVLFGWKKVKPIWHFLATLGVFLGSKAAFLYLAVEEDVGHESVLFVGQFFACVFAVPFEIGEAAVGQGVDELFVGFGFVARYGVHVFAWLKCFRRPFSAVGGLGYGKCGFRRPDVYGGRLEMLVYACGFAASF